MAIGNFSNSLLPACSLRTAGLLRRLQSTSPTSQMRNYVT